MNIIINAWHLTSKILYEKKIRYKILSLFLLSVVFDLLFVYGQYKVSYWLNDFYTALQEFNLEALYKRIIEFVILVIILITVSWFNYTSKSKLSIIWRSWMTEFYMAKWINSNTYFGTKLLNGQNDNPDQRLSEDINSFVSLTMGFLFGLLSTAVTLISFFFILWSMSGIAHISLFGLELKIAGYFVWIAFFYAAIGTLITYRIGRKLTKLDYEQEKKEANFRFSLMRLRENASSIAVCNGINYETNNLKKNFEQIIKNFYQTVRINRNLTTWQGLYANFGTILPIAAALPKFLAKEIQLGGLMQLRGAFDKVESCFSFLITSFTTIASYKAVTTRLVEFNSNIDAWESALRQSTIKTTFAGNEIKLDSIKLWLPDGKILFKDINLNFKLGKSYLITGNNGIGKSTLINLIRGIWPFASGTIELPKDSHIFFIPQKVYMPFGSLLEAISYPQVNFQDNDMINSLMKEFDIDYLSNRFEERGFWSDCLSLGEQQKISIIRAILANPPILVMDEATSAITEEDEKNVFGALKKFLPKSTIISVGHRHSLKNHHDYEIKL